MYNSPNIAIAIKEQAKIKNVTVKTMLEDLGFGVNTLSSLYHGKMILADRLAQIADYLDCTTDQLLGREVFKAPSCVCQGQRHENADNVVIQHFRGPSVGPMNLVLHGPDNEKSPALSGEAVQLACDFDTLDDTWKRAIRGLADVAKGQPPAPDKIPVIDFIHAKSAEKPMAIETTGFSFVCKGFKAFCCSNYLTFEAVICPSRQQVFSQNANKNANGFNTPVPRSASQPSGASRPGNLRSCCGCWK